MNELRRMAYLDALDIDGYVSRIQLAGAAQTRRLALVKPTQVQKAETAVADSGPAQLRKQVADSVTSGATQRPKAPSAENTAVQRAGSTPHRGLASTSGIPQLRFAVLAAGHWLWLESLGDMPLMREQVWLTEGMANALRVALTDTESEAGAGLEPVKAQVMQFDWPLHNNPQLDSSEDAVRASLTGFLERQQSHHASQGLVLMGESCQQWVGESPMPCVVTPSTRAQLEEPALKRQAWMSLAPLRS